MADQEFLASFGVEIDEAGVSRLQNVLSENRDLAEEVAAAFQAATEAIREYEKAASGDNPSGEGNRNGGTGNSSGNAGSAEGNRDTGAAGERDTGVAGAKKDGFWISDNPMQDLVRLQLGSVLTGDDAPAMPTNARELTLANLETMYLGQASRDSGNARKELISWQDIGLSSNPASIEGYDELVSAAQDLLREPMEKAREYMKQAMDAEDAGEDGSEYVRMVDEVLRKPLEQVRELVDNFDFGDEAGGNAGGDEENESELELDTTAADEALEAFREKASEPVSMELDASDSLGEGGNDQSGKLNMDLTEAKTNLESFRKDASKPVTLSGNASGIVSAARSAFSSVKSIFSTPVTLKVNVEKTVTTQTPEDTPLIPMSTGGRFTKLTDVQVAEDGDAEYIIPVKKEDRALPLLRQLLGELSPAARESLSLSVDGGGLVSLSGGLSAGNATAASITQNNQNVSAPVNIQVHASGTNAEQIGESIYDAAERYLVRTLRSSCPL